MRCNLAPPIIINTIMIFISWLHQQASTSNSGQREGRNVDGCQGGNKTLGLRCTGNWQPDPQRQGKHPIKLPSDPSYSFALGASTSFLVYTIDWLQPINKGTIANPILQLLTQSMDNIGHQAYAVCCLLPFLAFLLLLQQMHASARIRKRLNTPHLLAQHDTASSPAIITITSHLPEDVLGSHHRYGDSAATCLKGAEKQGKQSSSYGRYSYDSVFGSQNRQTADCSAGLARIKLINKRYFNEKASDCSKEPKRDRNRVKRSKKQRLESTALPPIIQGVQY